MIGKERSGVFLSYARKDGEDFAAALRERLRDKAPDIVIKQDRLVLEGGVGWWKQLTEAIDSVKFLILAMTPSSMQSETVRKEWRYARQQGVCVYPVKGAPELKFSELPRWMSKSHFFDIDKEWESFLAHLRKGCDTPRVPFMAPDLPEYFTDRPNEFRQLKNLLLSADRKEPVAIPTALSGAGGFGKTTLATALCHDEDVVQNFDDGILWVTLGQNPNVMSNLVTVYAALTGERPGFANEDDAAFQLAQKLEDRTCLLVIDDVWDEANLGPFLRGGKGCARLFTTRIAEIASSARVVNVDEMREEEALSLLSKGVPGLDAAHARVLTQRLGEWPIALELASAMMRQRIDQGDSTEHAAERLSHILDRKGPQGLARGTGDPRRRTIDRVLEGSLELLSPDDRRRLMELSIFPEDIAIPIGAAALLWGLDDFESEEAAQRFARLSLLKLDLGRGSMRLHDVMRGWMAAGTPNSVELHSRLVDGWPDWMRLPDSYAWRWLTWHLAQAGRTSDMERILWDPLWLQAKLLATDVNSLIGDFSRLRLREAELIQGALRLSSHILAKDPSQFASQLVGRLLPYEEEETVRRITHTVAQTASHPWLRPLKAALDPPGTGLLRTLTGHAGEVYAAAGTPDGRRAVSASWDHTLKVWDLETGQELRTLTGHPDKVNGVAVTPDGRRAVSASADSTLKVWDLETGAEVCTLAGHAGEVYGVAVTPDGRYAVSASQDNTLKVWDLETGDELRTLAGHSEEVIGVAVTPDGRGAVSASDDRTLKVWDLETGAEVRTLAGHTSAVNGVAVSPDGRRAVSASKDRTLKVWDLETGNEVRTLAGHSHEVHGVAVTPDGRYAVSASQDNTLKVWDLETGQELRSLAGHTGSVNGVAVTPGGRGAVSASDDRTLKVWDLETGAEVRTLAGHNGGVNGVAVSPDGRRAISASWDRTLKVWELETGDEVRTLAGHSYSVNDVAVTPDGRLAVSASDDQTLKVWDLEGGGEVRTLTGHGGAVYGVAVTPDGRRAVSASEDKTLRVWELETGNEVRTLASHSAAVNSAAVTQDGRHAISASYDQTLKVWNLETGGEVRTLVGHSEEVSGVAMTPDGRRAVSASGDKTLKVWELESGVEVRTLAGHTEWVNGVAVTPDGRHAISASSDQTLKVWDLETGAVVVTFDCDSGVLCCACADGNIIVAGDVGGRVHFLSLEL